MPLITDPIAPSIVFDFALPNSLSESTKYVFFFYSIISLFKNETDEPNNLVHLHLQNTMLRSFPLLVKSCLKSFTM